MPLAAGSEQGGQRAEQPPPVDVVKVQLAPPTQTLTLPGETSGWYSSTIYARVNGYLGKWFVDIGDRVHKDQVLATIDTPDLDAQLSAAQAQLVAAQAEEKVKEADAEFAKRSGSYSTATGISPQDALRARLKQSRLQKQSKP